MTHNQYYFHNWSSFIERDSNPCVYLWIRKFESTSIYWIWRDLEWLLKPIYHYTYFCVTIEF